jgi:hypothetical protein
MQYLQVSIVNYRELKLLSLKLTLNFLLKELTSTMKNNSPAKRTKETGISSLLQLTDNEGEETGKYIKIYII